MKNDPIRILLIEDNPLDARLMTEMLFDAGAGGYELQQVKLISLALQCLNEQEFDIVLLDLTLPDGSGSETVERICSACLQIPVVVLTNLEDETMALAAVQAGAQDYLAKGQVEGHEIRHAIRYAIERKRLEERLQFLATHDALTNLPNRRLFQDRIAHAIERSLRNCNETQKKWGLAVALLDLDAFKSVNDILGHAQGDLLLQAVADRLQASIRKSDTLARMGGDEFTLIYENVAGRQDAEILARKIQVVFSSPFQLGDKLLDVTASIGISLYPSDGEDAESLLRQADIAMYRAKRQRNTFWFYEMCKEILMQKQNLRILLIEDNPGDIRLVREALAETGATRFDLVTEIDLASGLAALAAQHIDAILLDLSLPDTTGFDTFTNLHEKEPQVPIILLTGADDDAQAAQSVRMGAQDYLVKGRVAGHEITRAIRYAIERKHLEERLQFLATHDDLTGLPNRRLFHDRMEHAIEHSRRFQKENQKKWGLAVALLDLDAFKSVNDTLGHAQGDLLLQAVADRLQAFTRKSDTLARMGGDEFTMIYENVAGRQDAEILAMKIQAVFSSPFQLGDNLLEITASIGISLYPSDGEDGETLLRQADIAMYQAKQQRNTFWFYEMCDKESSQ